MKASACKNGAVYDPLGDTCLDKNSMAYEYALPSLLFLSRKNKKKRGMSQGVRKTLIDASLSPKHVLLSTHGTYNYGVSKKFTVPSNVVIVFMTPASSFCWTHADKAVLSRRQRRQMIWGHHETVQSRTYLPGDEIADLYLSYKKGELRKERGAFLLDAGGNRKTKQLFFIGSSFLSSSISRAARMGHSGANRVPYVFFVSGCRGLPDSDNALSKGILQQDLMALQRVHADPLSSSLVGQIGKNISTTASASSKSHIREMMTYYTREALTSSLASSRGSGLDIQRMRYIRMTYLLSALHYQISWRTESIDESLVKSIVSIATKRDFKSWGYGGNPLTHVSLWYGTYPLPEKKQTHLLSLVERLSPSYQTRYGFPERHHRMVVNKFWLPDNNYKFLSVNHDQGYAGPFNTYVLDIFDQSWKAFMLGLLVPEYLSFLVNGVVVGNRKDMDFTISNTDSNWYPPNITLANMKRLTARQFLKTRLNSVKFSRYFKIALQYMDTRKSLNSGDVATHVLKSFKGFPYIKKTVYSMTFDERVDMVRRVVDSIQSLLVYSLFKGGSVR